MIKNFDVVTRAVGRSGLIIKKHSPVILTTVGIAGVVTAGVLACRATLKVEEKLDDHNTKMVMLDDAINDERPGYSEQTRRKESAKIYGETAVEFTKLYGPSVTLGLVSLGCIVSAHGILSKRNAAVMAAYKGLEHTFTEYRKEVSERLGEEVEKDIYLKRTDEDAVDENGKKTKTKVSSIDNDHSIYARIFDEYNPNWEKNRQYNLMFLICQQNYANDILRSRGHIFLNDVYDMLGMERTQAGAVVGWLWDGEGDDFVSFGIEDPENDDARAFVNGQEPGIILDFNVDGVIYDRI